MAAPPETWSPASWRTIPAEQQPEWPDEAAVACMRLLAGHGVLGGESGVAGLAGCLLAAADPAAREMLGLDGASRVMAFNTEGPTDPALFERLVGTRPDRAGTSTRDVGG